jgi:acetate kinase
VTHDDAVLTVNAGSSSLRCALFVKEGDTLTARARTHVEQIGSAACNDHRAALERALAEQRRLNLPRPRAASHRFVHGGESYREPVQVTGAVRERLDALRELAPLHLPPALAALDAVTAAFGDLPQVACFDTAFHATLPAGARRLPLPEAIDRLGVRRYGFHGLSYESIVCGFGSALPRRLILAHLGSGSSLVAVKDGRSIDTTMGFTPAGGIMMGTRPGDLDPGALLYLLRDGTRSVADVERMVEHESGLLGVGGTADMKTLLGRAADDARAALAVDMFCYAAKKAIGGLVVVLGGIDALVFTGAIGEHSAVIRARVCEGLEAFGLVVDPTRNGRGDRVISADASRVSVMAIATDEDRMLAEHAFRVLDRA